MRPSSRVLRNWRKPSTALAEQVVLGHPAAAEGQAVGVGDVPAELVVGRLDGETGCAGGDHDRRDLGTTLVVGAGARRDGDDRGDGRAGVGDERLGPSTTHSRRPTSTALVRVAPASLPASGSVRPNAASARPGDEVGQQALLLLLAAVGEDRVDAQAHPGRQRDADRLVDPAELLDRDAQGGERAAVGVLERPTELVGHHQAEQAEVTQLRHQVGREVVVAVPLGDVRLDWPGRELADHLAEVLVVLAQLVHRRSFAQVVHPRVAGVVGRPVLDVDVNVKQYSPVCQPP